LGPLGVLKCEYPFLISDETDVNRVRCTVCKSVFPISYGGKYDTGKHICVNKLKESLVAEEMSQKKFFFLFFVFFCEKAHW
jgi:hypothetical protein